MPFVERVLLEVVVTSPNRHVSGTFFGSDNWQHGRLFLRFKELKRRLVGLSVEYLGYHAVLADGLLILVFPIVFNCLCCRHVRVPFSHMAAMFGWPTLFVIAQALGRVL